MGLLMLIGGILTNALASVLLKLSAGHRAGADGGLIAVLLDWRLIGAVGSYFLSFLLYSVSLRNLPLSVAQPVLTASAIVLIGICSVVFFSEAFSPLKIAGYGLLIVGVVLIYLGGTGGFAALK